MLEVYFGILVFGKIMAPNNSRGRSTKMIFYTHLGEVTTTAFEVIMKLPKNQVTPLHVRCSVVKICRIMAEMYLNNHLTVLVCCTDQKEREFCIMC